MRYDQHLVSRAKRFEAKANLHRGFTTDARIDLVEDQRRQLVGVGADGFDRKHHPSQLAARRDAGQRLQRLPGVSREHHLRTLSTARADLRRRPKGDLEARAFEAQAGELGRDRLLHPVSTSSTCVGELLGGCLEGLTTTVAFGLRGCNGALEILSRAKLQLETASFPGRRFGCASV